MATDNSIIQDFDTYYDEAYTAWNPFYPQADRDLRFFLGDQWDEQEKRNLFNEGRSTFVFNRVRRIINLISGYQRKNRLSSVVIPVEDSDQQTADQLSRLLLYIMQYASGYDVISQCFSGALKTGWNLASVWIDYRDDLVNGDIKIQRIPYNGFITDPYFTELDFSDCSYILMRKYINLEQAESLLPNQERDVRDIYKIGWERDDKFTWLPYQRLSTGQEMMAFSEMYVQKWKNVPTLVDMETGETVEFEVDRSVIKEFLSQYPQLKVIKRPKRYIEKHIILNDHFMRTEINPFGLDEYPFVPFVAVFEPESDLWELKIQSVIRSMIDPQREANRRRSQMVDILDSQINSGWIANENSVINPRSLFQSSQGKVIWRREDAAPGALEKIPPAQVPPSIFQLQELFDRDMVEIAGINDAAFGQIETGNDSGVMMMLRQGAAITNLQDLFDNLRFSQKALSKKILKLSQKWKPAKVSRILNEEPTQQFFDQESMKYDIAIQEGILTDTQRQMYFRQLVDLRQLGVPVTGEMLAKAAPIQGKTQFIQEMQQLEEQQAKQAQEQQQIQQQLMDAQSKMSQAKAISDIALGKERFTRAIANTSLSDERAAAAIEDRTDAALNRVRAIKEMQTIDDDRLIKYLQIIKMMEEMSRQDEIKVKKDDVAIASQGEEIGSMIAGIPPQGGIKQNQQPLEVSNGI